MLKILLEKKWLLYSWSRHIIPVAFFMSSFTLQVFFPVLCQVRKVVLITETCPWLIFLVILEIFELQVQKVRYIWVFFIGQFWWIIFVVTNMHCHGSSSCHVEYSTYWTSILNFFFLEGAHAHWVTKINGLPPSNYLASLNKGNISLLIYRQTYIYNNFPEWWASSPVPCLHH